jgi:uncharacterized RDD family membrane protein YckC
MSYFLLLNGAQAGPYTWVQVQAMLQDGNVTADTLYWYEGMAEWQPLSVLIRPPGRVVTTATAPVVAAVTGPSHRFSGFWRRLAAYVIDCLILGITGYLLGLPFFGIFAALGTDGPLVGFVIAGLYFGLQDSRLCRGRTVGKRLMGIEVVNEKGRYLSPTYSFVRYGLIGVPLFLPGPIIASRGFFSVSTIVIYLLLYVWLVVMAYLLIFNRPSRQGLHDLIVRSYVVKSAPAGEIIPAGFWWPHIAFIFLTFFLIIGALFGVGLAFRRTLVHQQTDFPAFIGPFVVQRSLMSQGDIQYASVKQVKAKGADSRKRLAVSVLWNGEPDDYAADARTIASITLNLDAAAKKEDSISISIDYGYNIGIAKRSISRTYTHSPGEWRNLLHSSDPL